MILKTLNTIAVGKV